MSAEVAVSNFVNLLMARARAVRAAAGRVRTHFRRAFFLPAEHLVDAGGAHRRVCWVVMCGVCCVDRGVRKGKAVVFASAALEKVALFQHQTHALTSIVRRISFSLLCTLCRRFYRECGG